MVRLLGEAIFGKNVGEWGRGGLGESYFFLNPNFIVAFRWRVVLLIWFEEILWVTFRVGASILVTIQTIS